MVGGIPIMLHQKVVPGLAWPRARARADKREERTVTLTHLLMQGDDQSRPDWPWHQACQGRETSRAKTCLSAEILHSFTSHFKPDILWREQNWEGSLQHAMRYISCPTQQNLSTDLQKRSFRRGSSKPRLSYCSRSQLFSEEGVSCKTAFVASTAERQ